MKKNLYPLFLLSVLNIAHAELVSVSNDELDAEAGQAGVALSLDMRLNADANGNSLCGTIALPMVECRLALGLNHRGLANGGAIGAGLPGGQEWLVFKGIYGRLFVPYLTLDADTVSYTNDSAGTTTVAAVKFGIPSSPANKIQIQNLTISNMSVERDTSAINRGYIDQTVDGTGAEVGFLGIQTNGSVEISGTVKMFACIPDHPRC